MQTEGSCIDNMTTQIAMGGNINERMGVIGQYAFVTSFCLSCLTCIIAARVSRSDKSIKYLIMSSVTIIPYTARRIREWGSHAIMQCGVSWATICGSAALNNKGDTSLLLGFSIFFRKNAGGRLQDKGCLQLKCTYIWCVNDCIAPLTCA